MTSFLMDARKAVRDAWEEAEAVEHQNLRRVLRAFHLASVGSHDLQGSTGYGYGDSARAKLEEVYAITLGGESALVRPQIASGTHAIWLSLDALLKSGDHLLCVCGPPYDTLRAAITAPSPQSLTSRGVVYSEVALSTDGGIDLKAIQESVRPDTRLMLVQRSKGYAWRAALQVKQIEALCQWRDRSRPDLLILVDNCYGEFVEPVEPCSVGADLVMGSLIKNPGGTLAPGGGYVVGRRRLVEQVAERMTAPGLGSKVGPSYGVTPTLFQGFFMAPHLVKEAICGIELAAWFLEEHEVPVLPRWNGPKGDAVLAVRLDSADRLLTFCQAVQESSPIDHYVRLEPGALPGYEDPVVMAAGTFVQGSSSELSADGPMRPPYAAYLQGGISRQQLAIAIERVAERLNLIS